MSLPMLKRTRINWSQSEEAILVHCWEGDGWSDSEVPAELPLRSILACQQQYKKITTRKLKPAERDRLAQVWET